MAKTRIDLKKRRFEKAYDALQELQYVTAGTHLGGEVQFLLGETAFRRGKYPDAESHFEAYLNNYRGGPYSEEAVYMQARSKLKQIEKRRVGLLSFKKYIPHDRDISLIREARVLYNIYIESYPDGDRIEEARSRSDELLGIEGEHELEIANFYLRKKSPRSAAARAKRVLEGEFPPEIKDQARIILRETENALLSSGDDQNL